MIKDFVNKYKYWIYPVFLVILLILLSILHLHTSSVGMYRIKLFPTTIETDILFGSPRAIKSDQYLVEIPNLISQDINNEPLVNTNMADGINLGINNQPTKSIFTFFRPSVWIFFLSNNIGFNFTFYWWSRFALLLISTYLLLLQLTKKDLLLSIFGSLLFFFTPFIQWWIPVDGIITISFGLYCFIKLLESKGPLSEIMSGIGLGYWIISFVLILYPPFQIPMMYASIFFALGIMYQKRTLLKNKEKTKRLIFIFLGIVLLVAVFGALYMNMFKAVINTMANTVYPGERFISAGGGSIYQLLDGFYNILMQKDSNGAPFANQSEASNFFLLFIPLSIWVIYKNIFSYIREKKLDILGICIILCLLFFMAFLFLPLPDFLSKYTMMYLVPSSRMWIGIGFMNYILIIYILSQSFYKIKVKYLDWILIGILSISSGILVYKTGIYLYELNPNSFAWPVFVSPHIKILLVSLFVPALLILLLARYKKLFIAIFLSFAIASTIYINPVYKGLDILINTNLANYITEISEEDDSRWIVYGDSTLAQYALANNAKVLNGVHSYPQFEIWKVIDPKQKYIDVYNRYAHVSVSEYIEGEELVTLLYPDAIELNIDPCDKRLEILSIKYVLSYSKMNHSCLEFLHTFNKNNIFLYKIED